MDAKILTALEASIKHWEENAADVEKATPGSHDCALCGLFYRLGCKGCPVANKTANTLCNGSPYEAFSSEWIDRRRSSILTRAALAEVRFLKLLRPKAKAKRKAMKRKVKR